MFTVGVSGKPSVVNAVTIRLLLVVACAHDQLHSTALHDCRDICV